MEETRNTNLEDEVTAVTETPEEKKALAEGRELALKIAHILDERKALDIKVINVNKNTVIADYFVIAGGNSRTHTNALADEVEYKLGLEGITPTKIEGHGDGTWVLMDFDSVIVHVFGREARDFYKLEKLWAQGTPVEFTPTEN